MIVFDLKCGRGHTFEGWFDDSESYEDQEKKGLISCPFCNDNHVSKMLSTFAIKCSQPVEDNSQTKNSPAILQKQIMTFLEKNFDDVGSNFAGEALKIHYGVCEPRNIRGVSSEEEEKTLRKEGVKFIKIPIPASSPDQDA